MKFVQLLSIFAFVLASLTLVSCGGNGTYSPAISTGAPLGSNVGISIVKPIPDQTQPGGTLQFSAVVTGTDNTAVQWTVVSEGGGSINSSGLYTAPSTTGTYVIKATCVADPTKSATASTVVVASVAVSIVDPTPDQTTPGGNLRFTAVVTGTANTAVTWAVVSDGGGKIDSSGLYTAPSTAGTYTIKATSVADPTKSATTTLTVVSGTGGVTGTIQ